MGSLALYNGVIKPHSMLAFDWQVRILDLLVYCSACLYDMPWSLLDLGRNVTGNCNFDICDRYVCLWCWRVVEDEYDIYENYVFTEGSWSLIKLHLTLVGVMEFMANIFWIWLVTLAVWNRTILLLHWYFAFVKLKSITLFRNYMLP